MTREEAIRRMECCRNFLVNNYSDMGEPNVTAFNMAIEALRPVTAEPKTGHWEWVQYDYNPILGNWHCSECRCIVVECVGKKEKGGIPFYKYCPQCGCRMVEPQESEEQE